MKDLFSSTPRNSTSPRGDFRPPLPLANTFAGRMQVAPLPFSGLGFDFLSGVMPAGITFSRAGNTATRVNSSGIIEGVNADLPRFDYSIINLTAQGLLIEEARTNVVKQSQNLSAADWNKTNVTATANAGTSPDGSANASLLTENGVNGLHAVTQTYAKAASALPYSVTLFLKPNGRTWALLQLNDTVNAPTAWVNCSGVGSVGTRTTGGAWTLPAVTINQAQGGWYFVTFSTTSSTLTAANFICYMTTGNNDVGYQGDGVSGMYVWGVSNQQGVGETSYIPTTTAAQTRNVDVATVTLPATSDILVRDRSGGAWITGVSSGSYNLTPRSGQRHIAKWAAYPAGTAANYPGWAVAA